MTSTIKNSYKGLFYPQDPKELNELVSKLLSESEVIAAKSGKLRALIVPHAGYIYSGAFAASGYKQIGTQSYSKVILIGPSHNAYFNGLAYTSASSWENPYLKKEIDLIKPKEQGEIIIENDMAFRQEHSVEVQLPFIAKILPDVSLMILIAGEVPDFKQAALELQKELTDDTLLVISSDLSHYHDYETAREIDEQSIEQILKLDDALNMEQACGFCGINILIELTKALGWKPQLIDKRNSGDTAGDRSQVVGYAAIAFYD